jgi:hypothetical protein
VNGAWRAAAVLALVLGVAACSRDKVELTECEAGVSEIARTADVAPPNC